MSQTSHTLYVQECNAYGNWSASDWLAIVVDTTPPDPPSFAAAATPTNDPTPTWSWNSGQGDGWFRYRLEVDDLSGQPETTDTSYTSTGDLGHGDHTLYLQERDLAGNWSASASQLISVDLEPPNPPTVWTDGSNPTTDDTPTWRWSSGGNGGNGTYHRRLDGGALIQVTATSFTPPSSAPLAVGEHTLEVQERDALGNWSSFGSLMIEVVE